MHPGRFGIAAYGLAAHKAGSEAEQSGATEAVHYYFVKYLALILAAQIPKLLDVGKVKPPLRSIKVSDVDVTFNM